MALPASISWHVWCSTVSGPYLFHFNEKLIFIKKKNSTKRLVFIFWTIMHYMVNNSVLLTRHWQYDVMTYEQIIKPTLFQHITHLQYAMNNHGNLLSYFFPEHIAQIVISSIRLNPHIFTHVDYSWPARKSA